jgi:transmembrane sensor
MNRAADAGSEALRRYVRARAPDFGADERRALDAWLAADAGHRAEYQRLERTWRALDGLADALKDARASLTRKSGRPAPQVRRWLFGGLVSAGLAAVLFVAVLPDAVVLRHFETSVAQQRTASLPDGIEITLNADSAVDVVEGKVPRIDLVRGDIFVDVRGSASGRLEVRAGGAIIRDIGTRFSVAVTDQGGTVAVEQGQVELRAGTAYLSVTAGHSADFDAASHIREQPLVANAVAPWRNGRWQFTATPLSTLAAEMARQQSIRVDIADPAVAALTVSGSFGFHEPERVLWAAAQVHGLRLQRLGEHHFSLLRG